jgi:hypothetical protein
MYVNVAGTDQTILIVLLIEKTVIESSENRQH